MNPINLKNQSLKISSRILKGFEKHYTALQQNSFEAKEKFEKCQWDLLQEDSRLRLNFYENQVTNFCHDFRDFFDVSSFDEMLWSNTKLTYTRIISTYKQPELAETFYNSVFCRLFDKRFYKNNFIFVKPSISTEFIDLNDPIVSSYCFDRDTIATTLRDIIESISFNVNFVDLDRDINRLEEQIVKQLNLAKDDTVEFQIIKSPFYRRKGAYIVGKVVFQNMSTSPLLISMLNDKEKGIFVDAVLTEIKDISIVFSFSRSYFFIDTVYPAAVVDFLQSILPEKNKPELYSSIGLHKHGKNLLYRNLLQYSKLTNEKLTLAPGIKGMVMTVFTFPMFPYVFKVINDKFAPPKQCTPKTVKEKYFFVKSHCKVGRLADTWEFSNVAFPISDISPELMNELKEKVPSKLEIDGDLLIIKHLYIENKMIPLNLFMRNAKNDDLKHIIKDYGRAIDELINSDIFPGDMLTKNFGVTRQNRVVFYDYDEITPMNKPTFRKIPKPRNEHDELSLEPWYPVADSDVFPEEFRFFMFPDKNKKEIFDSKFSKLLDANYWCSVQESLKKSGVGDYYPYQDKYRMCEIYEEE
ncbi:MAG TPA: bifunctional isocitrate dehydrogenase kinase/phosphatase [Gammaproteobacteria bacterium]|jgi:isocitrate dehydrogenase kinase/phosphatase|nr:bifunctional isocitrate dehydrogenase kinase/phosphatase [Gammaproteobacteria bacterium]|tara:strand:- start:9316 stop:11061 length:1746 start_codon:yes stop_codon:yes gene_type:complete